MGNKSLLYAVIAMAMVVVCSIVVTDMIEDTQEDMRDIRDNVGTTVIFEGDTLMVTGYYVFMHSYTLSNGKEIDFKLIDTLERVE